MANRFDSLALSLCLFETFDLEYNGTSYGSSAHLTHLKYYRPFAAVRWFPSTSG